MNRYAPILALTCVLTSIPTSAQDVQIDIKTFLYSPKDLTVPAGTTVTWINDDQVPHTIVGVDKAFHSAALDTGDQYSYTFKVRGVFEYFCTLHPQMIGRVVVD
ncbi:MULTISPECIES: cupredoxin family copper-binding protein [unclassified Pseudomonas]|uniref:cupredoxin domain-containing protein n=1 Tax=unclassified Pseudomonas TaxID=196821 RepID=UPI002AC91A70|nr:MULTISPECIES: cupredoxin family copper-binding protein [unclassified Pseudomonas]MEB0041827.1 cupredoxin family copper-binding protein [Pseudomonas sp. MH10]MEB0079389.1 cupredoxin family copper-binding protein [Pseudomonas sp. MH10out]MEB0104292.1 cupredoxin family copper-binding protein [Pseudomonas sp. CCI3.2]MEB0132412.1 cupredoxin family copper-binding protein [Pseudomonas sp. CCI2.4]MEB0159694.1 cupredoxin family copper-binding protein [Pseudomonas sp. AH2 (2023)]